MEGENKCARCLKLNSCDAATATTSTVTPTLNLMEQLLLAKMEKHSMNEEQQRNDDNHNTTSVLRSRPNKSTSLLRTDSMDSQTSASTFSSILSNDSNSNRYCRCDDCLLGIADKYQQSQNNIIGRKKVILL